MDAVGPDDKVEACGVGRAARPELSEADLAAVARLDFVLVQSLGILWLLDPDAVPSGDELARAVAVVAGRADDEG
ncbi:hypothetical protein [Cellulosimicrobium sp. ES-005]|uniref:TetR transcriptional regulator CgmR-like C-terminal domain-containing protein n=1 Tax=Cellulosimicrobium sp. ES-005 TaxID=3163031 RepID=A0AAU8FX14_9MICO